jgi:hypothetical protein
MIATDYSPAERTIGRDHDFTISGATLKRYADGYSRLRETVSRQKAILSSREVGRW